jgi:hypothetical protein
METIMNMNLDIVNRALFATGQSPLTDADIAAKNSPFELCKAYYISTFLEALSEVEWVGGRKRDRLVRTGRPVARNRQYRFAYDMPFDCARPIELQNNEYFIVEDRLILTDMPRAALLYVSNGKVLRPIAAASCGGPGDIPEHEYFTAGQPWTEPDYTLYPGGPAGIAGEMPEDPAPAEDYPGYVAIEYEHKFHEYVEKKLAAKFAMKLSDQPQLHVQLLQEAMLVRQEAVNASRASRAAKVKETPWWAQELGLGDTRPPQAFQHGRIRVEERV